MKKFYISTFLVGFTVALWGCQSVAPNSEDLIQMTASQERRIGQLQSLGGAFTSTNATHLLKMDDGTNLYLKTDKIDLDSDKYTNAEVEVMGEILRTKDGNQIMTVSSIDVLDQENKPQDKLPQWQDYRSANLSLSLKYRDDYEVSESSNTLVIKKTPNASTDDTNVSDVTNLTIMPEDNLQASEMKIVLMSNNSEDLPGLMEVDSLLSEDILAGGFTKSKVTQKALEAYKKVDTVTATTLYYLVNSNGVYEVSFKFALNEDEKVSFQNMFYDILASIDFVGEKASVTDPETSENQDALMKPENGDENISEKRLEEEPEDSTVVFSGLEISGFTTFQSETAGFSVQYPKSYYFGALDSQKSDSVRSYEFGSSPLEESSGEIILEQISSLIPTGSKVNVNGTAMTRVVNGSQTTFYTEKAGKTYRISGQNSKEAIMKQMLSTLQ